MLVARKIIETKRKVNCKILKRSTYDLLWKLKRQKLALSPTTIKEYLKTLVIIVGRCEGLMISIK